MVTDIAKLGDKSFNDSAWAGVQIAAKELGVEPKVIETTDPNDYEKNIGQFVSEGYNVIVTVGLRAGRGDEHGRQGKPKHQVHRGGSVPGRGDAECGRAELQRGSGRLSGRLLAASVSKSGKIGAVLGTDAVPPVWRFGEGYRAGAQSVKPDINVQTVYHNDVGFDKTFERPGVGQGDGAVDD